MSAAASIRSAVRTTCRVLATWAHCLMFSRLPESGQCRYPVKIHEILEFKLAFPQTQYYDAHNDGQFNYRKIQSILSLCGAAGQYRTGHTPCWTLSTVGWISCVPGYFPDGNNTFYQRYSSCRRLEWKWRNFQQLKAARRQGTDS